MLKESHAKKILSLTLAAILGSTMVLGGCVKKTTDTSSSSTATSTSASGTVTVPENGGYTTVSYTASDDKYRNYYEIFVYSFYDSNGDGIGDLNGLTSKLDYLNDGNPNTYDDLGVDGIWLMPIMPSSSYHKYNVNDYMNIDEDYGTLDDFKKLLEEAHKRGINIIIDLVINHSGVGHKWFKKAKEEVANGNLDGYARYYNIETGHKSSDSGWKKLSGDYYYECEFDSSMPDLNLQNEDVRKEIQDIVKFWLDMGVDGFRLDAVKYYDPIKDKSIEDLTWLYDYAKSVKSDVYMVGECWDGSNVIVDYYKSTTDGFFNFDMQGATGRVSSAVNTKQAYNYVKYLKTWQDKITANNANAIDAPFISNHDTARSAGFFSVEDTQRMAAAYYLMSPGNPFIYYGEEIAMKGSENDPDKRLGMYWSSTNTTGYVPSVPGETGNVSLPTQSVEEALQNEASLLNFYKRLIRLKLQNPEIARGKITDIVKLDSKGWVAAYITEYEGSKVMVIFNAATEAQSVEIPTDTFTVSEIRGYAVAAADGGYNLTYSGTTMTIPARTVVVVK